MSKMDELIEAEAEGRRYLGLIFIEGSVLAVWVGCAPWSVVEIFLSRCANLFVNGNFVRRREPHIVVFSSSKFFPNKRFLRFIMLLLNSFIAL
jgi:hypothetical protein